MNRWTGTAHLTKDPKFLETENGTAICTLRVAWRDLLYQVYFVGVKSQSVVLITGAFTGMVLGAQTYFQFHKVKMDTATLAVECSREAGTHSEAASRVSTSESAPTDSAAPQRDRRRARGGTYLPFLE